MSIPDYNIHLYKFYENELSTKIYSMFKEGLEKKLKLYKFAVSLLVSGKYDFDAKLFAKSIHIK